MIAALFDSDGTLYSHQFGRGMMKYANAHGRRLPSAMYYVSLVPEVLLNKMKLGNPERFQRALIERMLWMIKGYSLKQATDAFAWVIDEYLMAGQRTDVIERVQKHQAQGHEVVVVSGMFAPALDVLCQRLGVNHFIGTQLEVRENRYTGRIIPPVIKGKDKAEKVHAYLESRGWDVDWKESHAYGDSFTDRDMLELVGHAVAVYPDKKLNQLAQQCGWEVLGTPKE